MLAHSPTLDWTPTRAAPALTAGARSGNLPTIEPLVGRDLDIGHVAEMVKTSRLVSVTGPPGVGKSRLALAVAHSAAEDRSDGAWLVELAPLADPSSLVGALAGVLALPSMPTTATQLVDQVGSRQMLLVLDNCEHMIEDVARLVAQLLAACPNIRVLYTSQEALAVEREHLWPLEPLAEDAAIALFEERASAVRPDAFGDPDAVEAIVRRLDCLPLAIELAAARTSALGAGEIAAQLDNRFDLLAGGMRGRLPRHRALSAMVDWSHDLLEPRQCQLFRRLGIFSGTFSRDAATEIADLESAGPATLAQDLDHLVRRSLVVADMSSGATRYRLLETPPPPRARPAGRGRQDGGPRPAPRRVVHGDGQGLSGRRLAGRSRVAGTRSGRVRQPAGRSRLRHRSSRHRRS